MMRTLVRLGCLLLLAVIIGCSDKKTEAPKVVAPPPGEKPIGGGPGKGGGAVAPEVKP
jgi:hypothetical protein